jgi:hypothetical protein
MLRFWRTNYGESWRVTLISIGPDATEQNFTTVKDFLIYLGRLYTSSLGLTNDTPPANYEIDFTQ